VQAGASLAPASWQRARARRRWILYALLGGLSAATIGPWLVLVMLGGACELAARRAGSTLRGRLASHAWPVMAAAASGGVPALAWVAFKVGALSYGGGFVIIPLMHADAVDVHRWMTEGEFLSAVALGQITPGPVVHTVAVVGYAAAGLGGGLLAATVAFAPSFSFILIGAERFDQLRTNAGVRSFLDGARPAAIGAIVGAAIPLALALTERWQFAVLAAAAIVLLGLRRGVVSTLVAAGVTGAFAAVAGAPLPS
jgi:chromate transporter